MDLWMLLLLLLATVYSKVDDNIRYDLLIGRHGNTFSPYDGAKQGVSLNTVLSNLKHLLTVRLTFCSKQYYNEQINPNHYHYLHYFPSLDSSHTTDQTSVRQFSRIGHLARTQLQRKCRAVCCGGWGVRRLAESSVVRLMVSCLKHFISLRYFVNKS